MKLQLALELHRLELRGPLTHGVFSVRTCIVFMCGWGTVDAGGLYAPTYSNLPGELGNPKTLLSTGIPTQLFMGTEGQLKLGQVKSYTCYFNCVEKGG